VAISPASDPAALGSLLGIWHGTSRASGEPEAPVRFAVESLAGDHAAIVYATTTARASDWYRATATLQGRTLEWQSPESGARFRLTLSGDGQQLTGSRTAQVQGRTLTAQLQLSRCAP
jgi:hypothetical protein